VVSPNSIPSRRLDIWRRMYAKLGLEPGPASIVPDVQKTILPVLSVDRLVSVQKTSDRADKVDLSASAGTFVALDTVPTGKRWTVTDIFLNASIGSSCIAFVIGGVEGWFTVNALAAAEVHGIAVVLNEGDQIRAQTTGNGGDNAVVMTFVFQEEDN